MTTERETPTADAFAVALLEIECLQAEVERLRGVLHMIAEEAHQCRHYGTTLNAMWVQSQIRAALDEETR